MPDDRKRERIVILFSQAEIEDIEAFRAAQRISNRSEMLRTLILEKVETWKRGKSRKAPAAT